MIGDGLSFSFWQIPTSNIMKIASVVAILLSSSMIFLVVVNGGGDLDRFLAAGGRHDASAPPAGDGGDNDERINEGFLPLGGAIRSGSGRTARASNGTPAMNFPSSVIGSRIENDDDNFSGSPMVEEEEAATVPMMTQSQQRELASSACQNNPSPANCPGSLACHLTKTCCMLSNYNIFTPASANNLSCGSNSVDFVRVTGFTVFDPNSYPCTCGGTGGGSVCTGAPGEVNCQGSPHGTIFGACRGNDDLVDVQFNVEVNVKPEYNVGLYVNTQGGNAVTGSGCVIAGLTERDASGALYTNGAGQTLVKHWDGNTCLDFAAIGTLQNYPFQRVTLKCADTGADKLLDFSIAVSFAQNDSELCVPDGPRYNPSTGAFMNPPPFPGTTSKCWNGSRLTLNINVPPYPSPTTQPSVSTMPSDSPSTSRSPSESPSISHRPSNRPSNIPSRNPSESPSVSQHPSISPSDRPSLLPSESPSISMQPSLNPSASPSVSQIPSRSPSDEPSRNPSESPSNRPSFVPSVSPSVSMHPSLSPSESPSTSTSPSNSPSFSPSVSKSPSATPSFAPSVSQEPSVSLRPSTNTRWPSSNPSSRPSVHPSLNPTLVPSSSPSVSHEPSISPSLSPSISKEPSAYPSISPSGAPSASPTGSLYYPDWINDSQKCINDGLDPSFMVQLQRDNYLYWSKEECCQNHFWWRIAQCMENSFPLYVSNGSFCEQKVDFEDWEAKYSPGSWDSSDLFSTLKECCNAKFWWDPKGCVSKSPKALVFEVAFDLKGLVDLTTCQDADIIANALEVAMNVGLGGGVADVKSIGCVTMTKDPDTGNPKCGGCLEGTSFSGSFVGIRPEGYFDLDLTKVSTITADVTYSCDASACASSASIDALYSKILSDFTLFVTSARLQTEISNWAYERVPPVPELWFTQVDTTSLSTDGTFTNPLSDSQDTIEATVATTTGALSVPSFVTPADDAAEAEAKVYFEVALSSALGANLPDGAVVTVKSIENGVVSYAITMEVDSSTDASVAAASISTSLANTSTLNSITASVTAAFSSSPSPTLLNAMSGVTVASNTAGATTESILAKVTTSGQLTTNLHALSPGDITAFENAIAIALTKAGALPQGATVTVSGIDGSGVVSFTVALLLPVESDNAERIRDINSKLSSASTLTVISNNVALPSLAISGFVGGETVGVSFRKWYPDWSTAESYCKNDGDQSPFMNNAANKEYYLFATKSECCAAWFTSATDCDDPPDPNAEKYVPVYSEKSCSKKKVKDLETYDRDRFETLDECCSNKFSYSKKECCGDGCTASGEIVYLPDWSTNKCLAQSKQTLSEYEETPSYTSKVACCKDQFNWEGSGCLS